MPIGRAGFRRGRRRGLVVGAAIGSAAARRNANSANDQVPVDQGDGGVAELEKLASLRDQGILTEEEFQAKKAQILGL